MSESTELVGFDWPDDQDVEALADVISRMYGSLTDPDDHLPDHCRAMARAILASDWLAERDAHAQAEAWDEAMQALAWAQDNGPDPIRYVAENNPYRAALRGGDA